MSVRRFAAALAAVALLASGCGGAEQTPVAKPTAKASETPAKPTPSPTPAQQDGDGSLVPKGLETGAPAANTTKGKRIFGADISWPQCPKGMGIPQKRTLGAPMPTDAARFVIIGLTNGPSLTPNPCLADQVAWARERKLLTAAYAVISWPQDASPGDLAKQGKAAAEYTIREMRAAGLPSPRIWLDVEPVPDFPWAGTLEEHAQLITGALATYREQGIKVGLYSTPSMYRAIAGDLRLGIPEWRAAGQTSMNEALSRCGKDWSIAGGQGVFGQWVEDDRDRNVTCPGVDLNLAEYFHQF